MAHIAMTVEEIKPLFTGTNPVVLPEAEIGLLVELRDEKPECGVAVAGENEIRWIDACSFQYEGNGSFKVFRPADPLTVPLHAAST